MAQIPPKEKTRSTLITKSKFVNTVHYSQVKFETIRLSRFIY
jgi:hypothetical protein